MEMAIEKNERVAFLFFKIAARILLDFILTQSVEKYIQKTIELCHKQPKTGSRQGTACIYESACGLGIIETISKTSRPKSCPSSVGCQ